MGMGAPAIKCNASSDSSSESKRWLYYIADQVQVPLYKRKEPTKVQAHRFIIYESNSHRTKRRCPGGQYVLGKWISVKIEQEGTRVRTSLPESLIGSLGVPPLDHREDQVLPSVLVNYWGQRTKELWEFQRVSTIYHTLQGG
jgi:hypothetical protein